MNHLSNTKIVDPFLQEILRLRRNNPDIADILRSVQADQNAVIDYDFSQNLIVQGCAGSGKTMILFHRLANILYNLPPHLHPSRIAVIIPNSEFEKSINQLVSSLNLEKIRVQTMDDYLLAKMESILEHIFGSEKSDSLQAQGRNAKRNTISKQIAQIRSRLNDQAVKISTTKILDLSTDTLKELRRMIDSYQLRHKQAVAKRQQDIEADKLDSRVKIRTLNQIRKMRETAITEFFQVLTLSQINRDAVITFLTYFNGYATGSDQLLLIDEGQDYSLPEYQTLQEINRGCVFNVFGDLDQRIFPRGLESWNDLRSLLSATYFTFNQDYRNSVQIVDHVNRQLHKQIISVGFSTKDVESISQEQLPVYLEYEMQLLKHRCVIITEHPELYQDFPVECKTVAMVKGIEYDTVFIAPDIHTLSEHRQYVALTRALSDLYIID